MPAPLALSALREPATHAPDAPVVVRFPALGDAVLLTVLLRALAARYGRAVHLLASGPWTPVLLGHSPVVDELCLVASRRSPHWLTPSRWAAIDWLAAHTGPVYLCEQDVWAERLIQRAGTPEHRLVRAWNHWPGDAIHWADWWLQIARLDAAACPGPPTAIDLPARPVLDLPELWHAQARQWLQRQDVGDRPIILVQPGYKKTHKRGRIGTRHYDRYWPAERWADVIAGVLTLRPDAAVLVTGSSREAPLVQEIIDGVGAIRTGSRLLNLAAMQPTVQRVCALAARAHSMISVDTGPSHVAAAMDCPLVVLYGASGWGRWLPRAATSTVIALGPRPPTPGARLLDLDAQQVLAAWASLPPRGERAA
jgi:heptosyltransferase III